MPHVALSVLGVEGRCQCRYQLTSITNHPYFAEVFFLSFFLKEKAEVILKLPLIYLPGNLRNNTSVHQSHITKIGLMTCHIL